MREGGCLHAFEMCTNAASGSEEGLFLMNSYESVSLWRVGLRKSLNVLRLDSVGSGMLFVFVGVGAKMEKKMLF